MTHLLYNKALITDTSCIAKLTVPLSEEATLIIDQVFGNSTGMNHGSTPFAVFL